MAIAYCEASSKVHSQCQHALVTLTKLTDLKWAWPIPSIDDKFVFLTKPRITVVAA
ncbi:hypothetical protein D3C81_2060720 [compost metagenome]